LRTVDSSNLVGDPKQLNLKASFKMYACEILRTRG
jgi:hypothetical protein